VYTSNAFYAVLITGEEPTNGHTPLNADEVFVDLATRDYALIPGGVLGSVVTTDAKPVGADLGAVKALTDQARAGGQ
jgi:hypothetical protein